MKILIVPMSAVAQTEGPSSRAEILSKTFLDRGIQVALCASKEKDGLNRYPLSVPVPMGLPDWLGLRVYPLADKLGIIGRKTVHSFEEVLHITGASAYSYLKVSIGEIRSAIRQFQPDVLYSEFNLSAMIAAKAENKPLAVSYSFPSQPSYASSPQFSSGVNRILKELGQPPVNSALELFERADIRVIPSSFALEPISGKNNLFVGPFQASFSCRTSSAKNCILIYMGNGTIAEQRIKKVVLRAFGGAPYDVYLAGMKGEEDCGNIHMARKFDFSELLPKTAVFINHGGQNSIMDGFLYGIPQLVCPGNVFERKYNAESVQKNGAGITLGLSEFHAGTVSKVATRLISDGRFGANAKKLGKSLRSLGGAGAVADYIASRF